MTTLTYVTGLPQGRPRDKVQVTWDARRGLTCKHGGPIGGWRYTVPAAALVSVETSSGQQVGATAVARGVLSPLGTLLRPRERCLLVRATINQVPLTVVLQGDASAVERVAQAALGYLLARPVPPPPAASAPAR